MTRRRCEIPAVEKIPAWSSKGVHDSTLACVLQYVAPGAKVLELGAGAGALSQKLYDAGYKITAGDYNENSFVPQHIVCKHMDCDNAKLMVDLFGSEEYDAVVCGDLIEHLKTPWAFVESISRLLKRHGIVFITTPNVTSPSSRINLLVNGNPNSFGKKAIEIGHISPIFPATMINMLESSGFSLLKVMGVSRVSIFRQYSVKGMAQALLTVLFRPLMRNVLAKHEIIMFVARKSSTISEISTPPGVGSEGFFALK